MIAFIVAMSLTLSTERIALLPRTTRCYNALTIDASIAPGGHANLVSNVFVVSYKSDLGSGKFAFLPIAYEYQTYGGRETWQFADDLLINADGSVLLGNVGNASYASRTPPMVRYSTNVATDLAESMTALGIHRYTPAGVLATIISGDKGTIVKADCYSGRV